VALDRERGPPLTPHDRVWTIRAAGVGGSAMIRWGEDDRGIPIGRGERARQLAPGGEFIRLPDPCRYPMLDCPNTVAGLIAEVRRAAGEDRGAASSAP